MIVWRETEPKEVIYGVKSVAGVPTLVPNEEHSRNVIFSRIIRSTVAERKFVILEDLAIDLIKSPFCFI